MLVQLVVHAKALWGPTSHREAIEALHSLPVTWLWQALILVPLAFHAGYGVVLALRPSFNVDRYPYSGNWMFVLTRVAALLTLSFIVLHVLVFWLPMARGELDTSTLYHALAARLSSTTASVPLWALTYVLGIAACVFHFCAGLWSAAARWGLTVTRSGRARLGAALTVAGLVMFAVGGNIVLHFAAGAALGSEPSMPPTEGGECPTPPSASSPAPDATSTGPGR